MAFLSEHESFPAGKFKDQVDASAAAFAGLTRPEPKTTFTSVLGLY